MRARERHQPSGFTLVEIMAALVIFGIVLTLSVPSMGRFLQSWRLSGETDQLASFLRRARSTAIMKNTAVVFKFKMADETYFYFEDTDNDGVRDNTEYQSETRKLPPGISFEGYTLSGPIIIFEARGNANESGTITLTNQRLKTRSVSIFGATGGVSTN